MVTAAAAMTYDAIVVGGGLGGLLAAATVAKRGGRVLVLERLRYLGGRFTTVPQDGYEITTGALHMAPHGSGGMLAQMIRSLDLPFPVVQRDVYASFYVGGRHIVWRRPWDIFKLFGARGSLDLIGIMTRLKLDRERDQLQPFSEWLVRQTADPMIHTLFERFAQFALSIRADQLPYREMRAIFKCLSQYGLPAIPVGGCKGVIEGLACFIAQRGGKIFTNAEVTQILFDEASGRTSGVRYRDRHGGGAQEAYAPIVVSDVGPRATATLIEGAPAASAVFESRYTEAAGLKLHIVSDRSMIPHNGIMFCLDTQRISGMVEVSRCVPDVSPGKHMIDTFQVWMSDDFVTERELALADLRYVFGPDFDRHCEVVRASAFRHRWPVNHIVQGADLDQTEPLPGLVMVGDAYKPRGHMMVEGVAASVHRVTPRLS